MAVPTEAELHRRIETQLSWRGATDEVVLIWHGYLAALFEWRLIEPEVYSRVSALLPHKGNKEISELFIGERLSGEQEKEIEEFLAAQKA